MLNRSMFSSLKGLHQVSSLLPFKSTTKNLHNMKMLHSCLCGRTYLQTHPLKITLQAIPMIRVHSTKSDQHQQKVVIETSTPKIVIEKLRGLEKNVLDDREASQIRNKVVIWKDTVDPYIKLMRLDKPIGIWLLYWPCSWSIALGAIQTGSPLPEVAHTMALFFAGAVLMRSAGCTINDLWDRDIDAKVSRTKDRPLVSGAITERRAIICLAAQLTAGLAVLLQLNWYSVALGASSMALVVTYPLAKRFTNYPQLFLGATFNWGALLGYSAIVGHVDASVCVPLYLGACAWTVLYDTIYAHQDKLDDARIGIKSTALTFGARTKPALAAVACASGAALLLAGAAAQLGAAHYAACGAALAHAGRQIYTLNVDCPTDCARKFRSNTWIGFILFVGIVAGGYQQYADKRRQRSDTSSIPKLCPVS